MTTSATILEDAQRVDHTTKLFGIRFPFSVEPCVFDTAAELCADYAGGYWHFYTLSNGGFYMAPSAEASFHVVCENGYEGDLSADAFGVAVCLYAYSRLSFSGDGDWSQVCAQHYHWLREYMAGHTEVRAILRAID